MDCGYFEQRMDRMLDGELSRRESTELHLHLRQCSRCRSLYAALCSVQESLQEDQAEAPEDLLPNVMDAVYAAAPRRRKRRPWAGWVATAACAALVIGLGWPVLAPKGGSAAGTESMALSTAADQAAPMAPAARAVAEEAPAAAEAAPMEAAPMEAAPAPMAEPAEAAPEASEPEAAENGLALTAETGAGDLPAEILVEEAAPMSLDGLGNEAWPIYDRFGNHLGDIRDIDSLLGLCTPGGEPLALTEFECDYNLEYNGLVYQFLVQEGRLYWRNDGESLLLPCGVGEDVLLGLIY